MRTTVELPDELLRDAKIQATTSGVSLRQFFIDAVEQKLYSPVKTKSRRAPPQVGGLRGPRIRSLSRAAIDAAVFG